ncbi:type II secretion system secretin GspD [uncultured Salinisphaera sp.]|uniref:type II secretion system secretin GspD n=1 Tax=uncultured Salinisphaera sp. TaxID=359372 RepID=UPI0032B1F43D
MTAIVLRRFCLLAFLLLAVSQGAAAQSASTGSGDAFTLNLKNADITTLIATVSEVTGRNFVVDPRVKGDVTVLSTEPMTPAELYETFLSVLEVHGFAAVPSGEITKIIPQINAKQDGGFGRSGGSTREDIVTRVISVSNVPADQLVPILRPLVPQYGHLAAYSASNTLIISDREANAQRIAEIVNKIDRNGLQDVETIRLQYASAPEVARVIDQLKAGSSGNAAAVNFSVIPDERTNSVIISGGRKERLRLRAIIADLDTATEQTGGTQVVYLDYADAESLAPVLQNFASGNGATASSASNPASASGSSAATRSAGGASANGVTVIAEPASNALVVTAPADMMREIKQVINQLDIRRGQVLVEAIIAEVTLSRSRQLGVNVAVFEDGGPAAASILDSNTLNVVPSLALDGTPLELVQQGINLGIGSISDSGTSFAVLVNALSGNTNTNVLSTPSLITRDNEEAEIKVGQEVPFVTGNYTSGTTGGGATNGLTNPFQTIERKDVGLTLGFTPQISAGDTIQLTIDQEVSSIAQGSSQTGAVDLITNNRTLTTSVEVENGQILVLGGLIDDQVVETEQKVPVLGDIPILGALFTNRTVQKNKRNLLNFIRPTILRGGGEADYFTRKKYNYIRSLQEQQAETSIPLMGEEQRPQLPPIEDYDDRDSFSRDSGVSSNESSVRDSERDSGGEKRRGDDF